MKIEDVSVTDIKLGDRYRTHHGDLSILARSIAELGLLQPIGVDEDRRLIFGARRLQACVAHLRWKTIPAIVLSLESVLRGQYAENEFRKQFTDTERVAIARAVEAELKRTERRGNPQLAANAPNWETKDLASEKGRTADIAARRAGFTSAETYERAKSVVDRGVPALQAAMDEGDVSISAAAVIAGRPAEEQKKILGMPAKERSAVLSHIRENKAGREADEDLLTFRNLYDAIRLIANFPVSAGDTWAGFTRHAVYDASDYLPRAIACLVRLDKDHPNQPRKPQLISRG